MSDKKLLGIDIGSYRLKIVESDGGRIRKAVTVDLPDNLVKNGRIVAFAAMALFIRETLKQNKFRYKDCAVSLSQENYYARRVHLPLMTTALLDVNLPFEFHDYISGDLGNYVYDYAVLSMDDKNMDLMAAATAKDLVTNYRVMMKKAGLKLVRIVPDVLALAAILYHPERIVDPSKTKKELSDARRAVEKKLQTERAAREKAAREEQVEARKAEKEKEKAAKKLAKSGFVVDSAETADQPTVETANEVKPETASENTAAENTAVTQSDSNEAQDFAVLDIGYSNAKLHFFSKGTFEITRTMEEGEKELAQHIVDERGIDIHIAMLKLEHNQDNILSEQGTVDQFDAISTEIMRVMNFYSYNNAGNTIDRIYYFGGGTTIPSLIAAIGQSTGLPLRPLTELIPGITDDDRNNLGYGPQAFGATIE